MKYLILSFLVCSTAFAEVYECEKDDQKYLLALTHFSGTVYSVETDYYKEMVGEVKVSRAMDGGPKNISFKEIEIKDDEFEEEQCYIVHQSINFTIFRGQSTIQYTPFVQINPACSNPSIPVWRLAGPQKIKCTLL